MRRRRRSRWYSVFVAIAAIGLPVAAIIAFLSLDGGRSTSAAPLPPPDPNDSSFLVHRLDEIRPDREAYRQFAHEDSLWRARERETWTMTVARGGDVWKPSARQEARDRAYLLVRRGDIEGAIQVLERWVSQHPGDRESVLDLARLLNQSGRYDASIARYRQLIGRSGGT